MQTQPITAEERARRQAAKRCAIHELRLEGLTVSDAAQTILQRHVDGELSKDEVMAQLKGLYVPSRSLPIPQRPQESSRLLGR